MRREPYTRATDVLYKLTTIYYQGKSEARYPRFEVRREVTGYFHSLEDAERRIRKYVTDEKKAKSSGKYRSDYDYYYGFVIDEIPFDWHLTGDHRYTIRIWAEHLNHSMDDPKRSAVLRWVTWLRCCRAIPYRWRLYIVSHQLLREPRRFAEEYARSFKRTALELRMTN